MKPKTAVVPFVSAALLLLYAMSSQEPSPGGNHGAVPAVQEPGKPAPSPQDPAQQDEGKQLAKDLLEQFAKEKIVLDLAAGTMTVGAIVNAPPDPIEYLLIHRKGKKHEAMFFTTSKPSLMNAGLLLLGLQPGTNAAFREKNPPPSLEELEKGVDPLEITEPAGMPFWMTVSWQDDQGKPVVHCVEDLVADLAAQEPLQKAEWIYLGGRMAPLNRGEPEVYVADFEGNLVSLIYTTPDNHLGTLKHERARDDENWTVTEHMPAHGKEVKFTFHAKKPKLVVDREARIAAEQAAKARKAADGGGDAKDEAKPGGGR